MSLRPSEFDQVARELDAGLRDARIQKAWATAQLVQLELRAPGRSTLLVLCAAPRLGRISVAGSRVRSEDPPPPFQSVLRKKLVGARLDGVSAFATGVTLRFEKDALVRALRLEVGSGGAIELKDETGKVWTASGARPAPPREGGGRSEIAAPSRLEPSAAAAPFPFAAAAERLFSDEARDRTAASLRKALATPPRRKRARLTRTLEKVRKEASRRSEAEAHLREGELISRNLHRFRRGDARVTLTEYTDEGPREVVLEVDPKRSPKAQADWHFHQYRRLSRGCEMAAERAEMLERERDEIDRALEAIDRMDDAALRAAAASEPTVRVGAASSGRAKRGEAATHRPFKRYQSTTGARILVGRGGAENDELTFHVAKPNDLWLHARGVSGAHVVVPLERGAEVPQVLLLDAAHLALHHSSARGEAKGEIAYTRAKFVRKPRGGAKGQVSYTHERTFLLRVEPERLERLLASRDREPSS